MFAGIHSRPPIRADMMADPSYTTILRLAKKIFRTFVLCFPFDNVFSLILFHKVTAGRKEFITQAYFKGGVSLRKNLLSQISEGFLSNVIGSHFHLMRSLQVQKEPFILDFRRFLSNVIRSHFHLIRSLQVTRTMSREERANFPRYLIVTIIIIIRVY